MKPPRGSSTVHYSPFHSEASVLAGEMAWDVAFRDGMSCSSQGKRWAAGTEREARAARDGASVLKREAGGGAETRPLRCATVHLLAPFRCTKAAELELLARAVENLAALRFSTTVTSGIVIRHVQVQKNQGKGSASQAGR